MNNSRGNSLLQRKCHGTSSYTVNKWNKHLLCYYPFWKKRSNQLYIPVSTVRLVLVRTVTAYSKTNK